MFLFFSKKSVKKISKYKYYILPYSKTYGAFYFISLQNDFLLGYISTVPEKMSYQKRYVPSKWLLDFDKYGYGRHVEIKWNSFHVPLNRFQMKIQILLSNFEKKVWNFWNPFLVKITMVNLVFHLKSDEGHIERFSFDVYMSPLPIFTKIKQPFVWHISFLVRHLSKYSVI